MRQHRTTKNLLAGLLLAALSVFGAPYIANATTVFDQTINSDTLCGGSCFGLTYELIITDAGDLNATTFTGTINITGAYTGNKSFISAVDFKPDGNSVSSANLTSAPGPSLADWYTSINGGQAAGDCTGYGAGFICSADVDPNSSAPTGSNLNYTWSWDFSMSSIVNPGHLGACFDNAIDRPGGPCVSIDFKAVPEPSTLILLGSGLLILCVAVRRFSRR